MLKTFKQKYKENPKFKTQVQRAVIFFGMFVVGISIFYAINTPKQSDLETIAENEISDNVIKTDNNTYFPTDTTSFVSDKGYFYEQEEKKEFDKQQNNADIVASSIDNASQQDKSLARTDAIINDYIQKRNASVRRMQESSSSRRAYNPYGNSNDYITTNTNVKPANNDVGGNYNNNDYSSERRQNPFVSNSHQDVTSATQVLNKEEIGIEVPIRLISQKEYVQNGERLTFALLEPCKISGVDAPKGQTLSGVVQEREDRLIVRFETVKIGNKVVRANITLYGEDGVEGIAITGADDETFLESRGVDIARSSTNMIPVVGSIVGDVVGHNNANATKKRNRRIKLVKNFTCFIVVK